MTDAAVVDVDVAAVGFSDGAVSPSLRCEPVVEVLVVAGLVVLAAVEVVRTALVVVEAANVRVADARTMLVEVSWAAARASAPVSPSAPVNIPRLTREISRCPAFLRLEGVGDMPRESRARPEELRKTFV
ncbi:MAG: hypothetical protein ACLP0J_26405 [Solirubrobacteraceae bacterium]